jgi:uncharacterized Zn finger protein (UPF0148 family)
MPFSPAPTQLHCPQCGWSKRETHSGDVMLPPSLIACPQCHEHKLQRETNNAAWGKTSLQSWLSNIAAKMRR